VRRRTYPSVGEDDGHDSGGLHDPGERVPHEPQELEQFTLLQNDSQIIFRVTLVRSIVDRFQINRRVLS
jgi:hypothetical protein